MCVIIVKKKNAKLPTKKILRAAYDTNPDGCGFATDKGEYFRTLKFDEFWKEFKARVGKDDACVIHFRWATHGSVKVDNCHPFEGEANGEKIWFAHNGVLSLPSLHDRTDSELCFREYVLPTLDLYGGFCKEANLEIRDLTEGASKFAFVSAKGLHLFGHFENYEGLLCSNLRFTRGLYPRPRYTPFISTFGDKFSGVGI